VEDTFLRLNRIPAALYNPEDLTPCQYDGVSELDNPTRLQEPRKGAFPHPNWQPNSLYLPRTVIGEQVNIRRLNSQAAGVPFYLLSHAPLDPRGVHRETVQGDDPSTPQIETSYTRPVLLDIYDAQAWEYRPGGAAATLTVRQFSAEPGGRMYFGPRHLPDDPAAQPGEHVFKVDYTYADPVTKAPTRIYGATVKCTLAGVSTQPLSPTPSVLSTMRVSEKLRALTDAEHTMFSDPANVQNWPSNAYYINAESSITGKIEFCPLVQTDPQPGDITLVKVDYRVMDWQILVFDVEVPPGGEVQLPITNLKGSSYINYPRQPRPQEVARGVRRYYKAPPDPGAGTPIVYPLNDPRTWGYLVAVDRQNGDILTDSQTSGAFGLPTNPYERRTQVRVDFRNGLLHFNYGGNDPAKTVPSYNKDVDTPDRSGRNYRIFCRAEADWAVQLMPAARVYPRASTAYPGGPSASGQAGGPLTYAWQWNASDQLQTRQLYFPLSEQGQTVAVDYYTREGAYVEGEVHTIGGLNVTDLKAWACPLSSPLNQAPNEFGPVNVRGLSVRARAVWVARGRQSSVEDVAKAVNIGYPRPPDKSLEETWRQVIVPTFITRTPI